MVCNTLCVQVYEDGVLCVQVLLYEDGVLCVQVYEDAVQYIVCAGV